MKSNHPLIDLTDIVKRIESIRPLFESLDYLPERFAQKVEADGECWLWMASKDPCGYGQFYWQRRVRKAHCVAYELVVGPVPTGLELDHLCRIRHCVRPSHLDPVPHLVNVKRGIHGVLTTHCPSGHAYDATNTHMKQGGGRKCRACDRDRHNARNAQLRAERIAMFGPIRHGPKPWTQEVANQNNGP